MLSTRGGKDACGPNGAEEWLNRGVVNKGWNPPFLSINNLTHISLDAYYNGVGRSCKQYDQYFKSSGKKYNIDPAILAFLVMQQSSCNADAGTATPGLMQCAPFNCQNGKKLQVPCSRQCRLWRICLAFGARPIWPKCYSSHWFI